MPVPPPNKAHMFLVATLGNFIITWSVLDLILNATIMRQLKINATRAAIVTSGLGFERKASIVRCLLQLHAPRYAKATAILNEIIGLARRNLLMHGSVEIENDGFRFIQVQTDNKMTTRDVVLRPKEFSHLVARIADLINEFKSEAGVSDATVSAIANIGKKLANKPSKGGKPHNS